VDVPDRPDVHVRLVALELGLGHGFSPSIRSQRGIPDGIPAAVDADQAYFAWISWLMFDGTGS
ncbi:hypothetical protein, partial [uncultured Albimonas sp.]|uniref:hypothetical protein n=1 Tax=uncultured Albimonas sp. TaxID=1331701 RepID=UPI0030EBCC03